ncbi:MAG: isochorismate synthase [Bacteroidales bacterium]|nr:isochorismate synthase [Bacteroidales bacterium]
MIFQELISKNIPFAAWRMPGGNESFLTVQKKRDNQRIPLTELEFKSGFVVAPYASYLDGNLFLIEPDFQLRLSEAKEILQPWLVDIPSQEKQLGIKTVAIEHDSYIDKAGFLISEMQQEKAHKVVFSRVMHERLPEHFSPDDFFDLLESTYPRAFVYLFFLPGEGLWCGATPETLLSKTKGSFETMALAGTQLKPAQEAAPLIWEEKERQEQAYVTLFIDEQLNNLKIHSYDKKGPETVFAGQLAHLCTRFSIPEREVGNKAGLLIKALHPTPAVCGLPRKKAAELIRQTEIHSRSFYTGFLGPWQQQNVSQLFVNLRCAKILDSELELYVGGGLTADSVPEKEWQETQYKSRTMLSVLEKMRNFAP